MNLRAHIELGVFCTCIYPLRNSQVLSDTCFLTVFKFKTGRIFGYQFYPNCVKDSQENVQRKWLGFSIYLIFIILRICAYVKPQTCGNSDSIFLPLFSWYEHNKPTHWPTCEFVILNKEENSLM